MKSDLIMKLDSQQFSKLKGSLDSIQRTLNEKRTITWYAWNSTLQKKLVEKTYLVYFQDEFNPSEKHIRACLYHPIYGFDIPSYNGVKILAVAFIDNIKFPDSRDFSYMKDDD